MSKHTEFAQRNYRAGALDAYDLLVTMLEERGINGLLEGIEWNARPETVARMDAYYAGQRQQREADEWAAAQSTSLTGRW